MNWKEESTFNATILYRCLNIAEADLILEGNEQNLKKLRALKQRINKDYYIYRSDLTLLREHSDIVKGVRIKVIKNTLLELKELRLKRKESKTIKVPRKAIVYNSFKPELYRYLRLDNLLHLSIPYQLYYDKLLNLSEEVNHFNSLTNSIEEQAQKVKELQEDYDLFKRKKKEAKRVRLP